jgi:DNA anti-recombination protein RmuC
VSGLLILLLVVAVIGLTALTVHHRTESRMVRALLLSRENDVRDLRRYRETFASIQHRGELGQEVLYEAARGCGLRDGVHFKIQPTLASGRRPDLVLFLDSGPIPVDAKCAVDTYWKAAETPDRQERQRQLTALARQIREHALDVNARDYPSGADGVGGAVLFVPLDAIAVAALDADSRLFGELRRLNVYLVGPTGFLILARSARLASLSGELMESIEQSKGSARLVYQNTRQLIERLRVANTHLVNLSKALGHVSRHADGVRGSAASLGIVAGLTGELPAAPPVDVLTEMAFAGDEHNPCLDGAVVNPRAGPIRAGS